MLPKAPIITATCALRAHCTRQMSLFGVWYKAWLCNQSSFMQHKCIVFTNLVSVRTKNAGVGSHKTFKKWFICCDHFFRPHFPSLCSHVVHLSPSEGQVLFCWSGNPYHRGIINFPFHSGCRRLLGTVTRCGRRPLGVWLTVIRFSWDWQGRSLNQ